MVISSPSPGLRVAQATALLVPTLIQQISLLSHRRSEAQFPKRLRHDSQQASRIEKIRNSSILPVQKPRPNNTSRQEEAGGRREAEEETAEAEEAREGLLRPHREPRRSRRRFQNFPSSELEFEELSWMH